MLIFHFFTLSSRTKMNEKRPVYFGMGGQKRVFFEKIDFFGGFAIVRCFGVFFVQNRTPEKPLNRKIRCFFGSKKTRIFVIFCRFSSIFDHWTAGICHCVSFGARTENGEKYLVQISDFSKIRCFFLGIFCAKSVHFLSHFLTLFGIFWHFLVKNLINFLSIFWKFSIKKVKKSRKKVDFWPF